MCESFKSTISQVRLVVFGSELGDVPARSGGSYLLMYERYSTTPLDVRIHAPTYHTKRHSYTYHIIIYTYTLSDYYTLPVLPVYHTWSIKIARLLLFDFYYPTLPHSHRVYGTITQPRGDPYGLMGRSVAVERRTSCVLVRFVERYHVPV